ncbi:MAG: hypothetical protein P9L97_01420 [Candidatus Tenebribacter davisii]|nr:hypothetical protein [Candidatus Tenebribacter davisii]
MLSKVAKKEILANSIVVAIAYNDPSIIYGLSVNSLNSFSFSELSQFAHSLNVSHFLLSDLNNRTDLYLNISIKLVNDCHGFAFNSPVNEKPDSLVIIEKLVFGKIGGLRKLL